MMHERLFTSGRFEYGYACAVLPSGKVNHLMWNPGRKFGPPEPAVISWEAGSDVIDAFVDCSFGLLAQREVAEELVARFGGLALSPVEMVQAKSVKRPKGKPRWPRVFLPYEGPELCELWPNYWAPFEMEPSSLEWRVDRDSVRVATIRRDPAFVVQMPEDDNAQIRDLDPGEPSIFVRKADLAGHAIFGLRGFPWSIFMTEDVIKFCVERGWRGVLLLRCGEII